MRVADTDALRAARWLLFLLILGVFWAGLRATTAGPAATQAGEGPAEKPAGARDDAKVAEGERAADAATAPEPGQTTASEDRQDESPVSGDVPRINLLDLYFSGGVLMYPITFMSFIVVLFGLERWLGLRREKVLPRELIGGLGRLGTDKGGLDPRKGYRLCQQFPSAAANVIKAMLLKVGRPHSELEHAVAEANEREAAKLYRNVRWLTLSASVTPLMGLLGTVQGMIMAFFVTAHLPTGANKAQSLAQGIYVALVTTFGGLTVAIPAAMLAHFFEGRIQRLFGELDELLLGLLPQLERFEGRLKVTKEQLELSELEPARPRPQTPLDAKR
jgi:biopolymer transport protein ExbB